MNIFENEYIRVKIFEYIFILVKNRAWSPSLPFPSPSCFLHRTVLYCTVLLYCTLLSSPLLFILQKLTCFESLTGRARLHPDTLLSLLRRSRDSLVFFESRLHAESSSHGCMTRKNEKTADESRNSGDPGHLDTGHWTRTTALCCNTGQNNDEKKSIHIKNRVWSPSLLLPSVTFFTSVKSKMVAKKKKKKKKKNRIPKIQKQLQEVKKNI